MIWRYFGIFFDYVISPSLAKGVMVLLYLREEAHPPGASRNIKQTPCDSRPVLRA